MVNLKEFTANHQEIPMLSLMGALTPMTNPYPNPNLNPISWYEQVTKAKKRVNFGNR